ACRDRQALTEVGRRVVSAEERPLPAGDGAMAQGVEAVERELKSPRPVVVERNLRPGRDREGREERDGEHRTSSGGYDARLAATGQLPLRSNDRQDGRGDQQGCVRNESPSVQGTGFIGPSPG